MYKTAGTLLLSLFISLSIPDSSFAKYRLYPPLGFVEFGGGYRTPMNSGDRSIFLQERDWQDLRSPWSGEFFKDGYNIQLGVGYWFDTHWQTSARLRFSWNGLRNELYERITFEEDTTFKLVERPRLSQWGLDASLKYMYADISEDVLSPFLGLGVGAWTNSVSSYLTSDFDSFNSRSVESFSAFVDFGLEFRIGTSSADGSFWTVASDNRVEIASTRDLQRFIQFGFILKYYSMW